MSSTFRTPDDLQWSERPRTPAARVMFSVGWALLGVCALGLILRGAWELWRAPMPPPEGLLGIGVIAGFVLVFLGTLLDRLRDRKTDPYREVRK